MTTPTERPIPSALVEGSPIRETRVSPKAQIFFGDIESEGVHQTRRIFLKNVSRKALHNTN